MAVNSQRLKSDEMKTASARVDGVRVSLKNSKIICKELKGKKLDAAKKFLERLTSKKESLGKKYYVSGAKKFLEILNSAESNAGSKQMDKEKLFIKSIKADKSFRFSRPRSHLKRRGEQAKNIRIEVEVEER